MIKRFVHIIRGHPAYNSESFLTFLSKLSMCGIHIYYTMSKLLFEVDGIQRTCLWAVPDVNDLEKLPMVITACVNAACERPFLSVTNKKQNPRKKFTANLLQFTHKINS